MRKAKMICILLLVLTFLTVLMPHMLSSVGANSNLNADSQGFVGTASASTDVSTNVRFGENTTITQMNYHKAWTEVPAPSNPGSSIPDTLEYWSTGNSAHTLVSACAGANDYKSGNAFAMVGTEFYIEGEPGQGGNANLTIDFSYNAQAQLINGGGTADTHLLYPNGVEHRALCTTWGYPRTDMQTFSGQESITMSINLEVGGVYTFYLHLYAHADVNSTGVAYSFCDVTIDSMKVQFTSARAIYL